MENRTNIDSRILGTFLNSATNAAQKGQSQFFTPLPLAQRLTRALSPHRQVLCDLSCGNGALLSGAANADTTTVFAADIDPQPIQWAVTSTRPDQVLKASADLTLLAPLLAELDWRAPMILLNPPWDLWWHRDRLEYLANSDVPGVAKSFPVQDGHTSTGTIDSTMASLMIALDRARYNGEGLLIANGATIERLMFAPGAPYRALAQHVWARITIPGNAVTGDSHTGYDHRASEFTTAVLYWARDHASGPDRGNVVCGDPTSLENEVELLRVRRTTLINGTILRPLSSYADHTISLWDAAVAEYQSRHQSKPRPHNLWLGADGKIAVQLDGYQQRKVNKHLAARLHDLHGKTPMELVVMRAQREELLRLCNLPLEDGAEAGDMGFRCTPELQQAVRRAVREYHAIRAPLYPLPAVMRLGYLDESETIRCKKSFGNFLDGQWYPIHTESVTTVRYGTRPNQDGEMETIEYTGAELCLWITDERREPRLFMEQRLRNDQTTININQSAHKGTAIDHSLQDLVEHFDVPEIPDISAVVPEEYNRNLATIDRLESVVAATRLKMFQREDYSRLACTPGGILAHDTGLGKSWAMYLVPLLKTGFDVGADANGPVIQPLKPILIVAPGDLHGQLVAEGWDHFRVKVTALATQADFYRLTTLTAKGERVMPPGFYITSFTQLSLNGTARPIKDTREHDPDWLMTELREPLERVIAAHQSRKPVHRHPDDTWVPWDQLSGQDQWWEICGHMNAVVTQYYSGDKVTRGPVRCVAHPSLSDLSEVVWDTVIVDEAVAVKGDTAQIAEGLRYMKPAHRFLLTATPVKNRFNDIFHLLWWACGGHDTATSRFPYAPTSKTDFTETFHVLEHNLSAEQKDRAAKKRSSRRFKKYTPQVCNVHRAWKFLSPTILRRRKRDSGTDIVPKHKRLIRVPMGTEQAKVIKQILKKRFLDRNGKITLMPQITALRVAAVAPDSSGTTVAPGYKWTPKLAACMSLISEILERREQVVVFSPFADPLDNLAKCLDEAGVPYLLLDGRTSQARRAELGRIFKNGPWTPGSTQRHIPIMLAAYDCMASGHNFPLCSNTISYGFPWAMDKVLQAEDRAWRLNSPKPVNAYRLITDGTIDRTMEQNIDEKDGAAQVMLDGHLLENQQEEMSAVELLEIAMQSFDLRGTTVDESSLSESWTTTLRGTLGSRFRVWSGEVLDPRDAGTEMLTCGPAVNKRASDPTPGGSDHIGKAVPLPSRAEFSRDSDGVAARSALEVFRRRAMRAAALIPC